MRAMPRPPSVSELGGAKAVMASTYSQQSLSLSMVLIKVLRI